MPRTGDVYALPAGSLATAGTTIQPTQHNNPLNDIAEDLNAARPIASGGTGATSAAASLTALGAQEQSAILDAIGTLAPAAMKMIYFDTNGDPQLHTVTPLSLDLIDNGNTGSMQTTLGLGNAATHTVQSSAADATADRVLKVGAL